MKTPVAVTLIVCGTVLIALPYIHNALAMKQGVDFMEAKTVKWIAGVPRYANVMCMIGGIVMIFAGATAGLWSPPPQGE